jgi:Na+-transporting NADH:ubiquinone oxidoreductase subunit F
MELTIVSAIIAFSFIILMLVLLLLFAQSKLVQSGDVNIVINGDASNPIVAPAGTTLLSTLGAQKIFLPSACGGGGTCAMCKCVVTEGGGDVLPTEVGHLSRQEQKEGVRLACQVKVKQDMKIGVDEEIFGIKKWECTVKSNYNVSTFIKEFVVELPEGEIMDFQSGGYIQIDVPDCTINYKDMDISPDPKTSSDPKKFYGDWDNFKMWDLQMVNPEPLFRAYSMANHPAEGNIIMLNIRIASPPWDRAKGGFMDVNPGVCSSYVFNLKPGDKVTISGAYGEFFIKDTDNEMVYIGGGAGMAPLRSHIYHLFHTLKSGRKVSYWYGGRSLKELFYVDQFRAIEKEFPNFTFNIALSEPQKEDNWTGYTGFIHQVLYDEYLSKHEDPDEIEYYFCGPPMMNQAVIKLLDDMGVPEENVAFDDFG